MLRAANIAATAGVRAIAIVTTGFLKQAAAIANVLGAADVPIVEYPGTIPLESPQEIRAKAADSVAPAVVSALSESGAQKSSESDASPSPRESIFVGPIDGVHEYFLDHGWTDGLPIIPPTLERVERFLDHTPREATESLGVLPPEYREATVWSVAVNGVMTGCRPEYMPILIAAAEAIADPWFRLQDAGSTPGWEPLVILSGPMVKRLGFSTGSGLMRFGPQANTSVGRFLKLYMRNVAGLRQPPGGTDKGSIGASMNVALAEDEAATAELGWPTFREDLGYSKTDDVVTVQSVYAISPPVYSGGDAAEPHLEVLTHFLETTCGPWTFTGIAWEAWYPLLLLGPSVARVLASSGITKDGLRQHLFETCTVEARWLEIYPHHLGANGYDLSTLIREGRMSEAYSVSDDPNRRVPVLLRPEWTNILVAGDPGRNQSRYYINNHEQGRPTSRLVQWHG